MLVSIIIPCYNQGRFLKESLQSVLNQTYESWECLIINDGSTDETELQALKWVEKDNRYQYYYKENGGVSSARNLGIEKAKGDYLQFLDCDDVLDENKLELSISAIQNQKNIDSILVISNFAMLSFDSTMVIPPFCDLKKEQLTLEGFLQEWNHSFSLQVQCGFFSKHLFNTIKFPETLSAQEDWMVWLQIMKLKPKVMFIDKPLAYYRVHPDSRMQTLGVGDNQLKVFDELAVILSNEEFVNYTKLVVNRCVKDKLLYKSNLQNVKRSNSYQAGLMIKKILKSLFLLAPFKLVFKFIKKLKK